MDNGVVCVQVKRRATAIVLNRQLCKAFQDSMTSKHMPGNTCRELANKIAKFSSRFPQALDIVAWQILGPAIPCCSDNNDTHHAPAEQPAHSCTDCILLRCHSPHQAVFESGQSTLMAHRKSACGCQCTMDSNLPRWVCRHQPKISELLFPLLLGTRVREISVDS